MTPEQVTFQEAAPWYFYLVLLVMVGVTAWSGYRAAAGLRALLGLRNLRKTGREASIPTRAISNVVWMKACGRLTFFAFLAFGMWVIVDANFLSFRRLDISETSIRIAYEWHSFDKDIPISDVQSLELLDVHSRQTPGIIFEVYASGGRVFRSVATYDKAVVADCRRIAESFRR